MERKFYIIKNYYYCYLRSYPRCCLKGLCAPQIAMIRVSKSIVEDIEGFVDIESMVVEVGCIEVAADTGLERRNCSFREEGCCKFKLDPEIELPYIDFVDYIVRHRSLVMALGFTN